MNSIRSNSELEGLSGDEGLSIRLIDWFEAIDGRREDDSTFGVAGGCWATEFSVRLGIRRPGAKRRREYAVLGSVRVKSPMFMEDDNFFIDRGAPVGIVQESFDMKSALDEFLSRIGEIHATSVTQLEDELLALMWIDQENEPDSWERFQPAMRRGNAVLRSDHSGDPIHTPLAWSRALSPTAGVALILPQNEESTSDLLVRYVVDYWRYLVTPNMTAFFDLTNGELRAVTVDSLSADVTGRAELCLPEELMQVSLSSTDGLHAGEGYGRGVPSESADFGAKVDPSRGLWWVGLRTGQFLRFHERAWLVLDEHLEPGGLVVRDRSLMPRDESTHKRLRHLRTHPE